MGIHVAVEESAVAGRGSSRAVYYTDYSNTDSD